MGDERVRHGIVYGLHLYRGGVRKIEIEIVYNMYRMPRFTIIIVCAG
jgi:hypothetical protein